MAASSGGLNNADFARMFRKEAQQEAAIHTLDTVNDVIITNDSTYEPNSSEAAARRQQQEVDLTDSTQDVGIAARTSGLGPDSSFGPVLGSVSSCVTGLGFRPGSKSSLNKKEDTGASVSMKTKTYVWEKHTTGFGTKMLAKMGFKGRLGKMNDGVSATIEVKKRPAQMGMGFGDFVEASNLKQNKRLQRELKGETVDNEEIENQAEGGAEDDSLWRKKKVVVGRKRHKRAADLTQEIHDMKKHKKSDTVLDMRGPSVRLLSDMKAAYHEGLQRAEATIPKLGDELIYNVRMVVSMAQRKVYDMTQKIDVNKESLDGMKVEAKMMQTQLNVNDVQLQHTQAMVKQLKALDSLREDALKMKSVEPLLSHLRFVRQNFPLEFDAHKLQQLVPSVCMPPLRALLMDTDLLDPTSNNSIVLQLRLVQAFLTEIPSDGAAKNRLQSGNMLPVIREKTMAEGDDLYNFVLEDTLWPAIVQCVNIDWHAKSNPTSCVNLYSKFRPHLSSEFEEAFLNQLVFVRLRKECQRWDPRSDPTPIHEWLLPWLPYVGAAMMSLYADIRLVLASALSQWHPSDLSVLTVLAPWRELWGEREYGKFTHRHIVRKLIRCLHRDFVVNPENQSLQALTWVLAWKDLLPHRQFVALLEGEFFPKWLNALRKWVNGFPNLAELEKWYCGWKLFFEKNKLATNERLLVHFQGALVLLQIATESVCEDRPLLPELNGNAATTYQDALALAQDKGAKQSPVRDEKSMPRSTLSHSVSLKDVIENAAISHNLTFKPKGFHDGQQVYIFGKHQIIIEQGVVFAEDAKNVFKPVDLEQLL